MQCTTVKPGYECAFMTRSGCGFGAPSDTCAPIAQQCEGCDHLHDWPSGRYCKKFAVPAAKWALGNCNMATHIKVEQKAETKKVNPLKASKKAAGRK